MKVVVSSIGRFHMFDLATQLQQRGYLGRLFTGYPINKVDIHLRRKTSSFPYLLLPEMLFERLGWQNVREIFNKAAHNGHDRWVSHSLFPCDAVIGLQSGMLHTIRAAHARGIPAIVDRGSTHIEYQDKILAEEHATYGLPYHHISDFAKTKAAAEYAEADLITVPSSFVKRTFIAQGVPVEKIIPVPYGVDLSTFRAVPKEDNVFRVLYVGRMSLRKGLPYLLEAFATLKLPNFEFVLIGSMDNQMQPFMARYKGGYRYYGLIPRTQLAHYYSQASVLVMGSIEEGMALVQAQAMACGVPLVVTENTGADDLITNGVEGFIVPIRDPEALRERVMFLRDNPTVCNEMARAARERVKQLGGWAQYGDRMVEVLRELASLRLTSTSR
jgi:alpha-maltose-1-phosphate synthase